MPADLLQHVIGPTPYSAWWSWLAVGLTATLVVWYVGVFYLTSPGRSLRDLPLVGQAREHAIRRRSARVIREIGVRYRAGDLDAASAGAAINREVRQFLHRATGAPAEYMLMNDVSNSEIRSAAPVLEELIDIRFNGSSEVDVARLTRDAEELILSWT